MNERREDFARHFGLTRQKAEAYYRRSLKSFEENDLENAILDVSEAIYYDRGFAEYYIAAACSTGEQPARRSRNRFQYAARLDKRQWLAHYGLGVLAYQRDEFEEAAKHFTEALRQAPDKPEALYYRALAYHELQEFEKAIADMEKAIELMPANDKRRKDARAWIRGFETGLEARGPAPSDIKVERPERPQLPQPGQPSD
jgi:tetratricopeptide (TPR) repeat protein